MHFDRTLPSSLDFPARDLYEILGVHPGASFSELKHAYYRKAKRCHPDRFAGAPEKEEEFKTLVYAFDVLSDPLRRRRYDRERLDAARPDFQPPDPSGYRAPANPFAVMDTLADDILEELIVGNTIPQHTTLRTLFLDLEKTERFCRFREAKNHFYAGRMRAAHNLLLRCIAESPENILYRYFLAQTLKYSHRIRAAVSQLDTALALGARRRPPLLLRRIRLERDALARRRLPFPGRSSAALVPVEDECPAERMRRRLARCMTRLAGGPIGPNRRLPE